MAELTQRETREELKRSHTPEAIRRRLLRRPRPSYLSDFVYGAIDGAVTTFAIVSGVAGAGLSAGIIIVLGCANLFGDGFSMAAANFLGTRVSHQQRKQARREEEHEIDTHPEGEREEVRQILATKGFEGDMLDRAVEVITSDREQWISMMMAEEHGIGGSERAPLRAALSTFAAFVLIGAVPLVPFALQAVGLPVPSPFEWSAAMTGVAFFVVGGLKSRFVDEHWLRAGLETLLVGGAAAAIAYGIGVLLRGVAA
jgi:VIT1/CCC1 family predicted Fe2+/Mn2+ transporter